MDTITADRARAMLDRADDLMASDGCGVEGWERLYPLVDLGAAWAEAEAALPEGESDLYLERHFNGYFASLGVSTLIGEGPTPASALRALAARLREAIG